MIWLIAGASHTGKTALAQRMLECWHVPYLSLDHLKMGLIRSGQTSLTPMDDVLLTDYLWPIAREMIRTALENGQSLIVEGCYIPADWAADFSSAELQQIRYRCLIMSRAYLDARRAAICAYANVIEQRLDDAVDWEALYRDNGENLRMCIARGYPYTLIDGDYAVDL